MLKSLLIVASAGAATLSVPADPVAPAKNGMLQCYRPDVQAKTCQSIAGYEQTAPGAYDNTAIIPVAKDATLETRTPVVVRGDSVCGFIRPEDMTGGVLRVAGRIVDPATAKPILERIVRGVSPLAGQEICTRYEQSGEDLVARVTVAGTRQPDQDQAVKWIGPSDGYTVTP